MDSVRVSKTSDDDFLEVLNGVKRKTLVYCNNTYIEVFSPVRPDYLPNAGLTLHIPGSVEKCSD